MAPDRSNNSKPQVGDLSQERLEALSRPDGDAALQPGPFAGLGEQVRKGVAEVAAQIDDRKRQDPGSSPYGPGSEAAADVPLSAAMGAALDAAQDLNVTEFSVDLRVGITVGEDGSPTIVAAGSDRPSNGRVKLNFRRTNA